LHDPKPGRGGGRRRVHRQPQGPGARGEDARHDQGPLRQPGRVDDRAQAGGNDLAKARGRLARSEAVLKTLGVDAKGEEVTSLVPVRSPINGTVTDRKVTEGQYETADSNALLTIANLSSVWIVADLFERDLSRVAVGQKAEIRTVAYPERTFTG